LLLQQRKMTIGDQHSLVLLRSLMGKYESIAYKVTIAAAYYFHSSIQIINNQPIVQDKKNETIEFWATVSLALMADWAAARKS
jgi:hypothetical protein